MSIPYLGSKINLVSKSEIRYEGILYTIDPKDSTIALAKVRSFGTENRKTDKPVAPRDEVYEYIIFRASDIKDLVVEVPPTSSTTLSDPAIIQAHSMSGSTGNFDNVTFGTAVNTGSVQSTTNALQSSVSSDQRNTATFASVFNTPSAGAVSATSSDNQMVAGFGSHDLRSAGSTPTPANRRSPLSESGNQVHGHGSRDKPFSNAMRGRENRDSRGQTGYNRGRGGSGDRYIPQSYGNNQYRRTNMVPQRQNQQGNYRGSRQLPPPPRRAPGVFRPQQSFNRGMVNHKKESGIKIDGDYDFEKANLEFQELENKLQKIKIDSDKEPENEQPKEKEESNAEKVEKKEEQDESICYDKSKSFFDQISCEALERSKGKVNRVDWKHERKLNAETFGFSNYRRGGGNYRGRGYGYRQNYYNQRNDHYGGNRQYVGGSGDSRRMNGPRGNRYSEVQQWRTDGEWQ